MANRFARKTGNWNAADVWSDTPSGVAGAGFVPTTGDVAMANGFAVTININATCAEVRTDTTGGATAGGGFTLANGVTLAANVYAGTTSALSFSGAGAALVGSVNGGSSGSAHGVVNSGSGTLTITGNATGGSNANTFGAHNNSTGTINITGNATGGSGSPAHGVYNGSTGTINITGNATGGSGSTANGAHNNSTGTINITGNATGGSGSPAYGASNAALGVLRVGRAIGNDHGPGYVSNYGNPGVFGYGTNSGGQPTTSVGAMQFGAYGQVPVAGRVTIDPPGLATAEISARRETTYAEIKFAGPNTNAALPAAADVRYGVNYNLGGLTGTCRVPPAGSVAFGVPVDSTTGTAVLSGGGSGGATAQEIWEYATRSLTDKAGFALTTAYDPAKSAASQASLAALNNLSAQQVWEYVARTLTTAVGGGATAAEVWGYAARSLTDKAGFALAADYEPAKSAASASLVNAVGAAVTALHDFNPATDTVAHVALVDTATTLTHAPIVPTEAEIAAAVWAFATRTLTQSISGGATPQQVWEYVSALLPDGAQATLAGLRDRLAAQVMTGAVVAIPAPIAGKTVAWCHCLNEHGDPELGVKITVTLIGTKGGSRAYDLLPITAESNSEGIASAVIPRGSHLRFKCQRGTGSWTLFNGVDADTLELPSMVGKD